jgi:hypothetical protein
MAGTGSARRLCVAEGLELVNKTGMLLDMLYCMTCGRFASMPIPTFWKDY